MSTITSNAAAARLWRSLLGQLVPATLVAALGVVLLGNLAKTPSAAPDLVRAEIAINAEAVFRVTPREPQAAEREDAKPVKAATRTAPKPKPIVAVATRPAGAEPPQQIASAPLPIAPQVVAETPAPDSDTGMMMRLRNATAAMQRIPQWASSSVSGWFAEDAPPRPPASVPIADFQASM